MLLLLGIFTITVLPDLLSPKDVSIPDISGMELEEAIAKLEASGLKAGEEEEIPDDEIEEGESSKQVLKRKVR